MGYSAIPSALSVTDARVLRDAKQVWSKRAAGHQASATIKDSALAKEPLEVLFGRYPDNPEVRLLLAGVHASQGELAKACLEIADLLELDFAMAAPRFERDPVFAGLRASPEGARLREHLQAVELLWRKAMARGLPSMLWRGNRGTMNIVRSDVLRGGIYFHESARFLPLEPGVEGAVAALVDPWAGAVAVVKTSVSACGDDGCPKTKSVDVLVYSLADWRRPPVRWHYGEGDSNVADIEIRSGAEGVAVKVHDCCCWNGCASPWVSVTGKAAGPASKGAEMKMSVDFRGSVMVSGPAGARVRGGRLLLAGHTDVQLESVHGDREAAHDILVDSRTGASAVMSTVDRCQCSSTREGPILRHVLSTVDTQGKAKVVVKGQGLGAAAFDGNQAVYVQVGDNVLRWPTLSALNVEAGNPIMHGVVLVVPRAERLDCCGL